MKYFTDAVVLLMLVACGDTSSYPVDSEECQPYHEAYSHSVTYCGDEQSVYFACNPRARRGDQVEGCVDDLLLKSSEDCYSENVCMNLWTEEE